MKKILALLLVAVMCLSMIACGKEDTPNINSNIDYTPSTNNSNETIDATESEFVNHPNLRFLFGTWELQDDEDIAYNPYSSLTVNEDGTCFIDDKAGTWNICNEQTTEDDLFVDLYCNNEKVASACLWGNTMSISALDAYGAFRPGVWRNTAVTISESDIILTIDNWRDYFELVTKPTYEKDNSGDLERLKLVQYIALKEEYANNVAYIDDVVVELKCTASRYYITLDATNDSYTLGDIVEEIELSEEARELSKFNGIYEIEIFGNNYIDADYNADPNVELGKTVILVNDINDIEFLRVEGVIYAQN